MYMQAFRRMEAYEVYQSMLDEPESKSAYEWYSSIQSETASKGPLLFFLINE